MTRIVLTEELIRDRADGRSFERGKTYYAGGAVRGLAVDGASASATVDGTRAYRVQLRVTPRGLDGDCSCPYGQDGMFCKHCVATALAWLARGETSRAPSATPPDARPAPATGAKPATATDERLRGFLESQDPRWLAAELLRAAHADPLLRARLEVAAGADTRNAFDDRDLRRRLANAIQIDEHDYADPYPYAHPGRVSDALSEVSRLIAAGFADKAAELSEYALELIEASAGHLDDSNGELGDALATAQEIHLEACRAAAPDPVELADRLLDMALASEYEVFLDALPGYAEVLGEAGMAHYRCRLEAMWQALPPSRPGVYDDGRFTVTYLMERLAEHEGGGDALIEVLARDVSSSYDVFRISERLAGDGRDEEALGWIQRGLDEFSDEGGHEAKLRTLGAECLQRLGCRDAAMRLLWANFAENPSLSAYQALHTTAQGTLAQDTAAQGTAEAAESWRERALALLAALPAAVEPRESTPHIQSAGHSVLVEVLLWEEDVEGAWQAAQRGGCREDLWLRLARARAEAHPADALPVLRQVAERLVEAKHRSAYRLAAGLLVESAVLYGRCGREEDFHAYMATLRTTHRAKRALRDELDRAGLPPSQAGRP
ncbi:SWIM zinc finger family protein [Nonomuraea lactucae]|uniref:SWIM zinc finger family protein n=1 Tax=Nonomuraea lactucae TaxID=2249762 RepID=UPI000DE2AEEF|nr:DUF6880 family protein [Nonomuraea lactucae]